MRRAPPLRRKAQHVRVRRTALLKGNAVILDSFENAIRGLTAALNGQYPRPWMTSLFSPLEARVFIVGYNPARAYPSAFVSHERHVDALFNRNGETCRGFYNEVTNQSATRSNIDMLTTKLANVGIDSVLETNVVCYATPKKKDLGLPDHASGKAHGIKIFRAILHEIAPKSIIIHGKGVRDEFNMAFPNEPMLPPPPDQPDVFRQVQLSTGTRAFVIPSLALPGYQNWPPGNSFCNWSDAYLDKLAIEVAAVCSS